MKIKSFIITAVIVATLMTGCNNREPNLIDSYNPTNDEVKCVVVTETVGVDSCESSATTALTSNNISAAEKVTAIVNDNKPADTVVINETTGKYEDNSHYEPIIPNTAYMVGETATYNGCDFSLSSVAKYGDKLLVEFIVTNNTDEVVIPYDAICLDCNVGEYLNFTTIPDYQPSLIESEIEPHSCVILCDAFYLNEEIEDYAYMLTVEAGEPAIVWGIYLNDIIFD